MTGTKTYTYDAMGMLAHGTNERNEQSSYTYNSLGFRVQRSQTLAEGKCENRSYVVDFTSPIRRDLMVNVENGFTQSLVYANGQLIEEVTQNRTPGGGLPRLLAVHEDIMGSIRSLTTEHGDVFAQIEYDVWGKPIHSGEHDMNAALLDRYTNHTYDAVLDAYHAQCRFYDAANRAFTSKDPVKDGLNWYGYVDGNPATMVDPLGLEPVRMYEVTGNFSQISCEDSNSFIEMLMTLDTAEQGGNFLLGLMHGLVDYGLIKPANLLDNILHADFGSNDVTNFYDYYISGVVTEKYAYSLGRVLADLVVTSASIYAGITGVIKIINGFDGVKAGVAVSATGLGSAAGAAIILGSLAVAI